MNRKIVVLALLILWNPMNAMAGDYVEWSKITMMQNAFGTSWIFNTDGVNANPDGCTKNIIALENSNTQYKELYGFLSTAYLTKKPVNIFVVGCTTLGYKKLSFVYTAW